MWFDLIAVLGLLVEACIADARSVLVELTIVGLLVERRRTEHHDDDDRRNDEK